MQKILKELPATLSLAAPIALGSASNILMGTVDTLMIGRVGTVPLAASAFTNSIFIVFLIAGIGLILPVAVLVSRSHGAGDAKGCATWLRHGVALGTLTGLAGMFCMFLLSFFLEHFGQAPEVIAEARGFYLLYALTAVPVMLFQVFKQHAESLGQPWLPMLILISSVGLNACLNWVLIFGHFGLPALGLLGAGIATLIARIVALVALVLWLRRKLEGNHEWPTGNSFSERWLGSFQRSHFVEILKLGLPSAGQLLFEVCAFSVCGIMMGWLGAAPLAAHQIALTCGSLSFMFPLGLSHAVSMRLSRNLGAGKKETLRPIGLGAFAMSWVIMGSFALCFAFGSRFIAEFFIDDQTVILLSAQLLVIAALFQLFDGTQVVGAGALRGLSDVAIPTLITGISYWVLAIPLSYLLSTKWLGPQGIWIGLAGGLAFAAITLFWRFLRKTTPQTGIPA